MKRRWKILIGLGVVLALIAASLTFTMHTEPQGALEAYKKELRAKGEKLDWKEVLPPPIPAESNSVEAFREAFGMFIPGDVKIPFIGKAVAPGKAIVGWNQPDARGWDFTNSWEDLAAEFEGNRPGLERLREVLNRPNLDFRLDYSQGYKLQLPELVHLKQAAQVLETATLLDLRARNTGPALTNVLVALALARNNRDEILLISHLVRLAVLGITEGLTWEFLQSTNSTDAQLAALQDGWTQMDLLRDAENSLTGERVFSLGDYDSIRNSPQDYFSMLAAAGLVSGSSGGSSWAEIIEDNTERPRKAIGLVLWRYSWSYAQELQMLKKNQILVETVRTMRTNQSGFYKKDFAAALPRLASTGVTNAGQAVFRALKIPDLGEDGLNWNVETSLLKTLRTETTRRIVITAIALKRFQLKQGKYPETLAELVPAYLPAVPIDPYDGKPLKYRLAPDAPFLLYGVGENGVDDGGDPTNASPGNSSLAWNGTHARDWVWPQPATEAEIQFFREHQSK